MAPIGYPLIIPSRSGEIVASPREKAGRIIPLKSVWSGRVSLRFEISFVRTRNGKSDGITDFVHNSIALTTATLTTAGKKRKEQMRKSEHKDISAGKSFFVCIFKESPFDKKTM